MIKGVLNSKRLGHSYKYKEKHENHVEYNQQTEKEVSGVEMKIPSKDPCASLFKRRLNFPDQYV